MLAYIKLSNSSYVYLLSVFLVVVMCLLLVHIHVYFAGYVMRRQTVGCWFLYLTGSLCLTFMDPPDCPTYTLLRVLHFSLFIPLGFLLLICSSDSCCWTVLVVLNAIFRLECLNRLVIRLIIGLK